MAAGERESKRRRLDPSAEVEEEPEKLVTTTVMPTRIQSGIMRQFGRQRHLPTAIVAGMIEPMASYAPSECENITQKGRRCQRAFKYRAVDKLKKPIGPTISCTRYCLQHCMSWLPQMLRDVPTTIAYNGEKPRAIAEIKIEAGTRLGDFNVDVDVEAVLAGSWQLEGPARGTKLKPTFWKVTTREEKEGAYATSFVSLSDPSQLVHILCKSLRPTERGPPVLRLEIQPEYSKKPPHLLHWGNVSVYFDTPGKVWFRPPHTWMSFAEERFLNDFSLEEARSQTIAALGKK